MPFPVDHARPPEPGELLSLQEVCARLDVDNKRVYVLAQEGRLHPVRLPGGVRAFYAEWEVEALREDLARGAVNIPYIAA